MGNKSEDLPFKIGTCWHGDGTPAATDAPHLEGKEYVVEDTNWASGDTVKPQRTGRYRRLRIMRNAGTQAALPKRVMKAKVDGSAYEMASQVKGFATTVGDVGYVVDEFLPAAGAPQHALFYAVIEGPAMCTTAAAGDTNIAIAAKVIPSTDGKVIDQDVGVAAGAATFNQIQGAIGRALKAVNATDSDILIDVGAK